MKRRSGRGCGMCMSSKRKREKHTQKRNIGRDGEETKKAQKNEMNDFFYVNLKS